MVNTHLLWDRSSSELCRPKSYWDSTYHDMLAAFYVLLQRLGQSVPLVLWRITATYLTKEVSKKVLMLAKTHNVRTMSDWYMNSLKFAFLFISWMGRTVGPSAPGTVLEGIWKFTATLFHQSSYASNSNTSINMREEYNDFRFVVLTHALIPDPNSCVFRSSRPILMAGSSCGFLCAGLTPFFICSCTAASDRARHYYKHFRSLVSSTFKGTGFAVSSFVPNSFLPSFLYNKHNKKSLFTRVRDLCSVAGQFPVIVALGCYLISVVLSRE